MACVITPLCVDCLETACADVCPVECIYQRRPDLPTSPEWPNQLYIHPDECIGCGNCEPACPWQAIYEADDVPAVFPDALSLNASIADRLAEFEVAHVRKAPAVTTAAVEARLAAHGVENRRAGEGGSYGSRRPSESYAVLDSRGRFISIHDGAADAIQAAQSGGSTRVFDGATGQQLAGPPVPDGPEVPSPPVPKVAASRPRDPQVRRLAELLLMDDEDEFGDHLEEARQLADELEARGRPLRGKVWAVLEDYGGHSCWGWRVSTVHIGDRCIAACREHFTAEAPHGRGWVVYEGDAEGSSPAAVGRLWRLGVTADMSRFPGDLDEAVEMCHRQWRQRARR